VRTVADRVSELETGEPTRFEHVVDRDAEPVPAGADDESAGEGELRRLGERELRTLPPR